MDENNFNTQDSEAPNLVPDGGDGNKMPLKRKVAIGATVALVVAGLGLGGAWATGAFAPKSEITKIEADSGNNKKQVSEKTDQTVDWAVKIEAEGVTADSSPLITRYVCTDGDDKGSEFYHATSASDAIECKDSVRLTEGTWEITAIPIINPDGSITTPAGGGGEQAVSGDLKDPGSTEFSGETKPAENVTQDDIDKVLDKVNEAVSKGDGTLTGDAGKDVVNKVTDNASKAPAADKEKVEEKKDAATDSAVKAEDKKTDAVKPSTSSGSAPSKSDSKPSSGSSSKPSHEHTWQAQYRSDPVYETRTRTVVDQAAWDEQVRSGSHFLFSDGHVCYDSMEAMNYQFDTGCSYSVVDDYKTVHHEAITHEEQYQVQTGTKQVLSGYRCSGCGATK